MSSIFGDIGVDDFLADYWQQQALMVRGAFEGGFPAFDEYDLAGLACEEFAESRLVQGSDSRRDWQLEHGPFAEKRFSALPESGWTLLVQDVEKHYPPLQEFLAHFGFLPAWRLDDLMISYAAAGGSVGPHVDQYDVFLVQVSGSKRWQIAESYAPGRLADCPLDVLESFSAQREWVLEEGDMLYLPPNIAHHGVAIQPGMTWSVGLRAPSASDLFSGMAEYAANLDTGGPRYTDPPLRSRPRPGEVDTRSTRWAADMMSNMLADQPVFQEFFATFMSRFGLTHEPANPGSELAWRDIHRRLDNGEALVRNPWTRLTWIESSGSARLYATGLGIDCSIGLATSLCQSGLPNIDTDQLSGPDREALTRLVNTGHLVFGEA